MTDFYEQLTRIKARRATGFKPVAETVAEAFGRMGEPNAKARISCGLYLDLCQTRALVVERLPHHGLLRWGRGLFLLWLEPGPKAATHWGTRLTDVEVGEVVRLRGIRDVRFPASCAATDSGQPMPAVGTLTGCDTTGRHGLCALTASPA